MRNIAKSKIFILVLIIGIISQFFSIIASHSIVGAEARVIEQGVETNIVNRGGITKEVDQVVNPRNVEQGKELKKIESSPDTKTVD